MTTTAPERKILTIERAKWYRGQTGNESYLLNKQGQMCCLGFDALARGLTHAQILFAGDPSGVEDAPATYQDLMLVRHDDDSTFRMTNEIVNKAIRDNDEPMLSDTQREQLIREDLKALGWDDVVFI